MIKSKRYILSALIAFNSRFVLMTLNVRSAKDSTKQILAITIKLFKCGCIRETSPFSINNILKILS